MIVQSFAHPDAMEHHRNLADFNRFADLARVHGRSIFGQIFERSANGLVQAASV
jgi:hypothetical protein